MIHSSSVALALAALALAFTPGRANACPATTSTTFTLDSIKNGKTPFGPCHNDGCGGYFIRWNGDGFAPNAQAKLQINALTINMSSETGDFGGLHKVNGNVSQSAVITLRSGEGATFNTGNTFYTNILSMTLQTNGAVNFKGVQLAEDSKFTLTIKTTTASYAFIMCSLKGSHIAFDHNGRVTGLLLRFCGGVQGGTTGGGGETPPPAVPEPTSLFALGLLGLGALRRRKS